MSNNSNINAKDAKSKPSAGLPRLDFGWQTTTSGLKIALVDSSRDTIQHRWL
jgi:hypothetical protein